MRPGLMTTAYKYMMLMTSWRLCRGEARAIIYIALLTFRSLGGAIDFEFVRLRRATHYAATMGCRLRCLLAYYQRVQLQELYDDAIQYHEPAPISSIHLAVIAVHA